MTMTSRARFQAVLEFQRPDRLPVIEWAMYWDKTIARWHEEGLPRQLTTDEDIRAYFGLDPVVHHWVRPYTSALRFPAHGQPIVRDAADYAAIRPHLYPAIDTRVLERLAQAQAEGAAIWFTFEGFFWHPRTLLGIEEHLYAFYDQPALMARINEDNLAYLHTIVAQLCRYCRPQFMSIAEDMSYNHGPMLSQALFEEHLAPWYRQAIPVLHEQGIVVFIDSDGLVDTPVDWYRALGADGFLPLEYQAGVDLIAYRQRHPGMRFLGGFNKLCMHQGEAAMRAEFERLLPVMRQGGYIPGVDHQTPPEVSLADYRCYLALLREYAVRAAAPE